MIKLKPCNSIYIPDDLPDFFRVMKDGQPSKVCYCLYQLSKGKPIPKDMDIEVILVVMHVISFHNQCLEEEEKQRKESEVKQ
nr:MAG TPA: hypothetical protein [Caudoviricetes sp.]